MGWSGLCAIFDTYLYGHRCDVFTDHEAIKALLNTPHPSGKLARWGLSLQELDLHIHYRPGPKNRNADALSRCPSGVPNGSECEAVQIAVVQRDVAAAKDGEPSIADRQENDAALAQIRHYLKDGTLPPDENAARHLVLERSCFCLEDDVLYRVMRDGTLRLVPPAGVRRELFQEAHAGKFGGHLRDHKVYSQLSRHYWWGGMRRDVSSWCRACETCASRRVGRPIRPPLVPLPVAGAFDRVGVDVIQFVQSNSGNKYAIVFIDYLTKWVEVFPTADQTALTIARLLVTEVISRHGVPRELLSDRGAAFLSSLLQEVSQIMGLHKVNTTAYHPQGDGLVERFNRTLTEMLSKTVERSGKDWDTRLPYVLFAYRTSVQESTQESPFHLLYGRDPCLPTEETLYLPATRSQFDVGSYQEELVIGLQEAWEMARAHVKKAQRRQQRNYDKRATPVTLRKGDRVYLHVPSAKQGKAHKFARPFRGPYRIVSLYNNGADIRPVDKPHQDTIRVSLNRLRKCPKEIPGSVVDLEALERVIEEYDVSEGDASSAEVGLASRTAASGGLEIDGRRLEHSQGISLTEKPPPVDVIQDDALLTTSVKCDETREKAPPEAVREGGSITGSWTGRLRDRKKIQSPRGRGLKDGEM